MRDGRTDRADTSHASSDDYIPPPHWALPDEPPILVNEPKLRRNHRRARALDRQPIDVRIADAELMAKLSLANARSFAGDKKQELRRDVQLGWAAHHATRAALLKAMKSSKA